MHMAQLMPLPLTVSSVKSRLVYLSGMIRYDTRCYFNVCSKADISQLNLPAHPGSPGKRAVNGCVCRLPILSARPAVTLATLKTTATNSAAW